MPSVRVHVNNQQSLFDINSDRIAEAVRSVLADHDVSKGEVSVALVDDARIQLLNCQHLNHDYPTDVLSFLYESHFSVGTDRSVDGELIVNTDMARRVGREYGLAEHDELLLYVVHGALHLVGFDDDTVESQRQMRDQERQHLRRLGIELPEESLPGQTEAQE